MRPAVWTVVAFMAGILGADWLRPHPGLVLVALFMVGLGAAALKRGAVPFFLVLVALAGALRYAYAQTAERGDFAAWLDQTVTLVGTVTGEPELRQPRGVGYTVTVETVGDHAASGKLYVAQTGGRAPEFGDRVAVTGKLKEPLGARVPGGYDRAAALARQGVYLTLETGDAKLLGPGDLNPLYRLAVAARTRLNAIVKATLPKREGGLMAGLLLGNRADLPQDIKEAFRNSGVFHLLAVSGGHLAMVLLPLLFFFKRAGIPKRVGAVLSIPAIIFFVLLTGAGPSVLRAGAMAILLLLGVALRREKDTVNTLAAAVLILLVFTPGLLFDAGFQLSAGATLGILLFAQPIQQWLEPRFQAFVGEKAGRWLAAGLSVTAAAQVLVEPISLYTFGATSTVSPITNLIVLAFLGPVIVTGWIAVLLGFVSVPIAAMLNEVVLWGLRLLIFVVKTTAAVPGAYIEVGQIPAWLVIAWYSGVAVWASPTLRQSILQAAASIRAHWAAGQRRIRLAAAALFTLALLTGFTWRLALADSPDTLVMTVLDVGQGDAILIQAPGGHAMLIDAGPAAPPDPAKGVQGYDAGRDAVVPALKSRGIKRLDYLVLTHPHQDHAGGMPAVLQAVSVRSFLDTQLAYDAAGYRETLNLIAQKAIPVQRPTEGDLLHLGPVTLEVLNPPMEQIHGTRSDENNNSIVFRLRYRQVTMLLTGDIESVVEQRLLAEGLPLQADLLKVGHHGSGYSSTEEFLAAVHSRWALVSVGNGNLFGHPDRGTLERLWKAGNTVYRTDKNGAITVKTNGEKLTVTAARGEGDDGTGRRPLGLLGRRLVFAW